MNEHSDLDNVQAVNLIKSVLSLEYCLQYQIIPLTIKQGCLNLGMVNPEDRTALDFIRPIVNTIGYSLTIQQISSEEHQLALAEYLKNSYATEQNQANISPQDAIQKARDSAMTLVNVDFDALQKNQPHNSDDKATVIGDYPNNFFEAQAAKTACEDSKATVYAAEVEDPFLSPASPPVIGESTKLQTPTRNQRKSQDSYRYSLTHQDLKTLTPQQLWQELFTKILDGTINELCLKSNFNQSIIAWTQPGTAQAYLNDVSLSIIQALIDEIKTLARIPLEPLQKTKKLAIEKHYQQERLQLRIDASPGKWGDDITIKVLRGKELQLHEQEQIKKMREQALMLADKLAKILKKMNNCFKSSTIGDLSQLKKAQQEIDRQLNLLSSTNLPK